MYFADTDCIVCICICICISSGEGGERDSGPEAPRQRAGREGLGRAGAGARAHPNGVVLQVCASQLHAVRVAERTHEPDLLEHVVPFLRVQDFTCSSVTLDSWTVQSDQHAQVGVLEFESREKAYQWKGKAKQSRNVWGRPCQLVMLCYVMLCQVTSFDDLPWYDIFLIATTSFARTSRACAHAHVHVLRAHEPRHIRIYNMVYREKEARSKRYSS